MWSAISKIFTRNSSSEPVADDQDPRAPNEMERTERRSYSDMDDSIITKQAKQRASMKWLLSKAYNNKVPENLKEPFYKDHEGQEHLKPQVVGGLANGELYCLALGHIYSDPAYHSLNHWAIVQALARKGAPPADPPDAPLTETTLIQTNPLRMNAHMAVIDAMMRLYAKEVLSPDRVWAAVRRFGASTQGGGDNGQAPPRDPEEAALRWVGQACRALAVRAQQEIAEGGVTNGETADKPRPPSVAPPRDLRELSDGAALAALVAHYCPEEVDWREVRVPGAAPSPRDAEQNVRLVRAFCSRCLPADVCHLTAEDIIYFKDSMKLNLLIFLADLFNLLEINPVRCVKDKFNDAAEAGLPARNAHGVVHKRNLMQSAVTPIPDLRSGLDDPNTPTGLQVSRSPASHQGLRKTNSLVTCASEFSEDSLRRNSEDSFVVHRGKAVPTLRSVISESRDGDPLIPARLKPNKERQNTDSKAEERGEGGGGGGEPVAAGKPSNWEDRRVGTFAGRRSRRNSITDDSQLTIENFGGSQDNINYIGRNPDKELTRAFGKPSNWEDQRKGVTYAGRRSRRNSVTDESQLTIENFGGSQDNINFIGRNPDKEVAVHVGRKISAPSTPNFHNDSTPVVAVRSSLQDARGSIRLGYDYGDEDETDRCSEKKDDGSEKSGGKLRRQMSSDDITLRRLQRREKEELIAREIADGGESNEVVRMSFKDVGRQKMLGETSAIQLVYMNDRGGGGEDVHKQPSFSKLNGTSASAEKKTTFAALPSNTTTWQQQSSGGQHTAPASNGDGGGDTQPHNNVMAAQLSDIRLKLEEKRRHIESEKRRMEMAMNRQRQKVGKQAFLQAVSKEITDDASKIERKWLDDSQPYIETRRTPDLDNMDLETYQQSIAQMNSSLHDIQSDMQRLASQQSQMQAQTLIAQQQRQIQQLQEQQKQLQSLQHQYSSHQTYQPAYQQPQQQQATQYAPPLQSSLSAPHIPQSFVQSARQQPDERRFFLHDHLAQQQREQQPSPPQRRTWAQQSGAQTEGRATWGRLSQPAPLDREPLGGGFVLHDRPAVVEDGYERESRYRDRYSDNKYHNGEQEPTIHHSNSFTLSQQHLQHQQQYGTSHSTPSASPQHRNIHRQISQLLDDSRRSPVSLHQLDPVATTTIPGRDRERKPSVTHAPIPAPSADDMEPQNISFIGNSTADDAVSPAALADGLGRLKITSGSRTYRIPSPTRPASARSLAFHPSPTPPPVSAVHQQDQNASVPVAEVSSLDNDPSSQKGFYISFDNEPPKRPKPPLRTKRMSPKKERSYVESPEEAAERRESLERLEKKKQLERELAEERQQKEEIERRREELIEKEREKFRQKREESQERERIAAASALIIGNELSNPDPEEIDERERKKERIMLLSLRRRQRAEEARARKEAEEQARREREREKEEEKARRKEEQAARRAAILEQYKLKKALEEAEREGKTLDRSEFPSSMKPSQSLTSGGAGGPGAARLRAKGGGAAPRPRPKTIHIDSGSVQLAEGMAPSSRGKKGSTTNLTAYGASSMRRDYYRGSQDSLADRSMSSGLLYKDSPDDSHGGVSPCHSSNQTLGRRSSYKTSRDPSPAQSRSRSRYTTAQQNFRGRKSSSMMNLYGSSTDQDSMAYRFGDTDSGLGRATPPRRAPSPGMGRHLPSPSGPGSLPPGLMQAKGRRGVFDDGSSDISSTPSSMMDYTGPRLYKQPATKSNRSIILNAVEYCVFPGVVNRDAKRRVLEEIARSDSKHFLILFRDAGCQFRALYSYCPDTDTVAKLYGTGPKLVNDKMFDKFFKYNSGGKCFSQVHTKHLTVTIDAFTIHNSLWQGKKVNLPNKKDMALVI